MCPGCRQWDNEYVAAEVARLQAEDPPPDESAEFQPVPRTSDDGLDLYEGRHRAWQDQQEARYLAEGMSPEEERDCYGAYGL